MRVKIDLEARYAGLVAAEKEEEKRTRYRGYLDDFIKIQDLLHDKDKVRGYLRALSAQADPHNIHASLSAGEQGYSPSKPILLFNTSAFTTPLNRGQLFVDTLVSAHGTHAHRIQWNVIGQDVAKGGYQHSAVQLFRESSRVWWRGYLAQGKGKYMWEQILDTFDQDAFTSPESLTKFIVESPDDAALHNLSEGVKAAEASRLAMRWERVRAYVASPHFKEVRVWAKGDRTTPSVKRDDTVVLDGWTYTGFVTGRWTGLPSDIKKPLADQPVPTIVYPPGHDPEARPPEAGVAK